jgi:inner membrane transporter RhtA
MCASTVDSQAIGHLCRQSAIQNSRGSLDHARVAVNSATRLESTTARLRPESFFAVSAVFHYLGPAFAVLLFAHVPVLGVAWLRIASAAAVFAFWRRPWRIVGALDRAQRRTMIGLAAVLCLMNSSFYLAVDRLPLSTVGAIEFLGTIALAVVGLRSRRNFAALAIAVGGVVVLTDIRIAGTPLGFVFAFGNCVLFMLYVVLGHRVANIPRVVGIDVLGLSMVVAAVVGSPVGLPYAATAFVHPLWLLVGAGVGVCSSVIPYVTDQLAMARIPRATFAMMLAILPASAAIIGAIVLRQIPSAMDVLGIGLVIAGVALHQPELPGS